MKTKNLLTILKPNKSNKTPAGFTLIELIVSASISVVVIGAAGFGLMSMLRGNKTASLEANSRTEVNRALEFISDEIRRAETIETNPTTAFTNTTSLSNFGPTQGEANAKDNAQPILALNIPGVSQPILYYISPPESNAWQGPRVIYRFGPPYRNNGSYNHVSDPTRWNVEPLVDRIDNDSSSSLASFGCPSGYTDSFGAEIQGFYACVEDTGKTAQIYVVGQLENGETYQADTNAYARAKAETLVGNNPTQSYGVVAPPTVTPDGEITFPRGVTITPQILGSLMGCNPSGDACEMRTEYRVEQTPDTFVTQLTTDFDGTSSADSITLPEQAALEIVVTPRTNNISNPYSSEEQNNTQPRSSINDSNHILFLASGDTVPNTPAWNSNSSNFQNLNQLLAGVGNGNSFIDANGRINLQPNQYILAFEVGQTDNTVPGYDRQDHVILMTITDNN